MSIITSNMIKDERRQAWEDHMPALYRGTYRRALAKEGRRFAISAKCQDCTCWQPAEIRQCVSVECPLYEYRPGQKKVKAAAPA